MSDEGFLPEWAEIKASTIEGVRYGIFTNRFIEGGDSLGWVREVDGYDQGPMSRSVVGWIGNCDDDTPNTFTLSDGGCRHYLIAARDIEVGEEIMWKYELPQYGSVGSRPWDVAS